MLQTEEVPAAGHMTPVEAAHLAIEAVLLDTGFEFARNHQDEI
jgi:hypothetical protein